MNGNAIILGLIIAGAICDWLYIKKGGVRPTRKDKRNLGIVVVVVLLSLVAVWLIGSWINPSGNIPGAVGTLSGVMTLAIFGFWEIDRFRVRRKNPIPKVPK
jgi:phosphotransferase system  glucose/maltose/N-acetylglucosamine-specific IIC component